MKMLPKTIERTRYLEITSHMCLITANC